MRIALDTNVLLAAFATRGLCEAQLETCLAGHDLVALAHFQGVAVVTPRECHEQLAG